MVIDTRLGALLFFCACITSMSLLPEASAAGPLFGTAESVYTRAVAPDTCPPGFRPATPPLNPALGCLPNNFYAETGPDGKLDIPPGGCPSGWRPVTPPLNPLLVCLPDLLATESFDDGFYDTGRHRDRFSACPSAWVRVTHRREKEALICLPKRIVVSLPDPPPGECPDGWRPVTPPVNPVLGCLPDTIIIP